MYLRFLRTQVYVFGILTVFTAIVLYPTYVTADNRNLAENDPLRPQGIEIASLSNVPDKSGRLWVTLFSEVVIVATICYFLYADIKVFTKYRRLYRADPSNPSNYAVLLQDIPTQFQKSENITPIFDTIFPGQVLAAHPVRDARMLASLKEKYITALSKRERAMLNAELKYAKQNDGASHEGKCELDEDVLRWQTRQDELREEIRVLESDLDVSAPHTHAAVVVFRSKRTATFAATAPLWAASDAWKVSRAAEPRAVNWAKLNISAYTRRIREYISFACLSGLAILWTIPAGLIQALGNFKGISSEGDFLDRFVERHPDFAKFLEGVLPPLLLFVVLLLIPLVVRFVVSFERIHSRTLVEAKIRNFLFFFYVMSNFVYVVIIGSVFQKLRAIIENPATIVSLLSTSVPAQATFLMKYVLINAFLGSTLGMLNIGRLLIRPFLLARAKTRREISKAERIFSVYPFAKTYALTAMVSLISYVYATIAPIICAVALAYFCIAYMCTKQLLLYSHRPIFEGGGYLYRDTWNSLLFGLYVHQISMIGIFSLKRAIAQAILAGLSFVASVWFTFYCRKKYLVRAKHGALMDLCQGEDDESVSDEIPEGYAELYINPGLLPVEELSKFEESDLETSASCDLETGASCDRETSATCELESGATCGPDNP